MTVALKRSENAMIADKPDVVLKLSARIPTGGMRPTSNNRHTPARGTITSTVEVLQRRQRASLFSWPVVAVLSDHG
ncbi:hypothetical protein ACIQNU_11465 [Streptomyces sp. NPDC091292]|uniref:hypothetical protein n=1 Tax=Streptomyces sp. NPDC091292 TaxID=3365991 RepID=UPI003815A8ED